MKRGTKGPAKAGRLRDEGTKGKRAPDFVGAETAAAPVEIGCGDTVRVTGDGPLAGTVGEVFGLYVDRDIPYAKLKHVDGRGRVQRTTVPTALLEKVTTKSPGHEVE